MLVIYIDKLFGGISIFPVQALISEYAKPKEDEKIGTTLQNLAYALPSEKILEIASSKNSSGKNGSVHFWDGYHPMFEENQNLSSRGKLEKLLSRVSSERKAVNFFLIAIVDGERWLGNFDPKSKRYLLELLIESGEEADMDWWMEKDLVQIPCGPKIHSGGYWVHKDDAIKQMVEDSGLKEEDLERAIQGFPNYRKTSMSVTVEEISPEELAIKYADDFSKFCHMLAGIEENRW